MREPALSEQLAVENDARMALYLGLGSFLCIPLGIGAVVFGVKAIGNARSANMSTPGSAIFGILIGVCSTLCFGGITLAAMLAPTVSTPEVVAPAPEPEPSEPSEPEHKDETPTVQPNLGGGAPKHLTLHISKIYEKQQPSPKPPYHHAGGDWTFFDLQAGEGVELTAGVQFKESKEMFSFGKAQLSVPSREAGAAFVSAFNAKFGGTAGKTKPHRGALSVNIAVLGTNMVHERGGGFRTGRLGTWTATKLFTELDGHSGEVFFNYSLEEQLAEFSEKDSEYADDLAYTFSAAFEGGK